METVLEAIARLKAAGYVQEMSATADGKLRCSVCADEIDPSMALIDETVRFEGESDPDDEEILLAISTSCGHKGWFSAAYGPDTPPEDVAVLQALTTR
jgi:hypothetical protein